MNCNKDLKKLESRHPHPTQSIIYIPLQVNRFQISVLLIVRYEYLKSCSGGFILQNLLVVLLNLVGFFISTRPSWSGGNFLYHSCTSFEGASRRGQPLNIFAGFIGAGGKGLCNRKDISRDVYCLICFHR